MLGLFNADNQTVLTAAEVAVTITNNEITEVTQLTLNEAGTLNANDATIAKLIVNVDQVSIENLTVLGDVTLTNSVTDAFNVTNVKMDNLITAETSNLVASERNIAAVSTRLKITFTDSTVAYVEIRQDNVHFAVGGLTLVESVSIKADGAVFDSPTAVLPSLKIEKGVTKVELNASIANVVVETDNPVEIGGKGNFDSVVVNTEQAVKISTEGTIGQLESTAQNVELGTSVKVGETIANGESVDPGTIIKNIDEVKDNVNTVIKEEDKVPYFVAKPMLVKDKFGFITLSLTNAADATIKYEYVDENTSLLNNGQTVSANAKMYTEGQEIPWWFLKDLHVYKVDNNNKVIEAFRITKYQVPGALTETKMTGDTLTIKSIFSEELAIEFLYIADDTSFWMTEEKVVLTKDANGIPTATLKVGNGLQFNEEKTYAVQFDLGSIDVPSTLLARDTIGDYNNSDIVNLNLLKRFKHELKPVEKQEGFNSWDYYRRLEDLVQEITKDYKDGVGLRKSYYQFVLNDTLKELTDFSSVEAVKATITNVETRLAVDVKAFNEATAALGSLYRDDRYDYNYEEQLRPEVTQKDIDAAKAKVDALPEWPDKVTVQRDLDTIIHIFERAQLKPLSVEVENENSVILNNVTSGFSSETGASDSLNYWFSEDAQMISSTVEW